LQIEWALVDQINFGWPPLSFVASLSWILLISVSKLWFIVVFIKIENFLNFWKFCCLISSQVVAQFQVKLLLNFKSSCCSDSGQVVAQFQVKLLLSSKSSSCSFVSSCCSVSSQVVAQFQVKCCLVSSQVLLSFQFYFFHQNSKPQNHFL
jgi:hypothetical protein